MITNELEEDNEAIFTSNRRRSGNMLSKLKELNQQSLPKMDNYNEEKKSERQLSIDTQLKKVKEEKQKLLNLQQRSKNKLDKLNSSNSAVKHQSN